MVDSHFRVSKIFEHRALRYRRYGFLVRTVRCDRRAARARRRGPVSRVSVSPVSRRVGRRAPGLVMWTHEVMSHGMFRLSSPSGRRGESSPVFRRVPNRTRLASAPVDTALRSRSPEVPNLRAEVCERPTPCATDRWRSDGTPRTQRRPARRAYLTAARLAVCGPRRAILESSRVPTSIPPPSFLLLVGTEPPPQDRPR